MTPRYKGNSSAEERGSILMRCWREKQFSRASFSDGKTRLEQPRRSAKWKNTYKPPASGKNVPSQDHPPCRPASRTTNSSLRNSASCQLRAGDESDSTRIVTLMVDAFATPVFQLHPDQKTTDGYHNLSHHGQAAEKVKQLEDADRQQMAPQKLLHGLATKKMAISSFLTAPWFFSAATWETPTPDNPNPILLAGGSFLDNASSSIDSNAPLCNLFVNMLQHLGIECDAFGSSTGTMTTALIKRIARVRFISSSRGCVRPHGALYAERPTK
jgi:hypothetical protein